MSLGVFHRQVDPMEIVTFAEKMNKTVDTAKFWKLFNSLDHDNSADLDEDEFVKLLDGLTERVRQRTWISVATKLSSGRVCICVGDLRCAGARCQRKFRSNWPDDGDLYQLAQPGR